MVSPGVVIGDNVKIQNNVSVYTGVILEDDVFCGPSMVFTNVINPRSHVSRKDEYPQTLVKRGASLGANCTIVCGHTDRRVRVRRRRRGGDEGRARLRAGRRQPGRIAGWMCECGVKLASGRDTAEGGGLRRVQQALRDAATAGLPRLTERSACRACWRCCRHCFRRR